MEEILKLTKKGIPITVIGLPYAGKTTFVNWLKEKKFTRPKPTVGFDFEQIKIDDVIFNIFDISGQKSYRASLWKSYIMTSVGIIFVFDSSDIKEIDEARKWFWVMIDDWLKSVFSEKVILFLANKSDLKTSQELDIIIDELKLNRISLFPNISFQIFKTSIRTEENLIYALKWLVSKIKQATEAQEQSPLSIVISDSIGTPLYIYDPLNLVNDPGMFIGYLKALSGFANEILGHEKLKVIKLDPHYFFISEENNYVISVAVSNDMALPEAGRISYLIHDFISSNENKLTNEKLEEYVKEFVE
ncbi:MAG: GTP-binding protein [Candidatus Heimdallarchaeota archaeon]|nr:GTP-binding protein [Candidatus Heimdallarchaeota archaeon]MCK4954524.1 GTP-binding protein [Candidatus Heimdallarchaeota archaeon]